MARKRFTDKDRARIFANAKGACHLCERPIQVGEAWEVEHVIAWELTRDDSDSNLKPAHVKCHKTKTHKQDRPAIKQAKRREAKHIGVSRPSGKLRGQPFPATQKATSKREPSSKAMPPRSLFCPVGGVMQPTNRTFEKTGDAE